MALKYDFFYVFRINKFLIYEGHHLLDMRFSTFSRHYAKNELRKKHICLLVISDGPSPSDSQSKL
jgi:hypothetical protein